MGKLLEQLRTDYQTKETEIKAPVVKALNHERREKEAAISKYHEIEFKLGQDFIKYAMELAKREIAQALRDQLFKVLRNRREGTITLQFDLNMLRLAEPDRTLRLILDEYVRQSRPSLKIETIPQNQVEMIEVFIPELNLRFPTSK